MRPERHAGGEHARDVRGIRDLARGQMARGGRRRLVGWGETALRVAPRMDRFPSCGIARALEGGPRVRRWSRQGRRDWWALHCGSGRKRCRAGGVANGVPTPHGRRERRESSRELAVNYLESFGFSAPGQRDRSCPVQRRARRASLQRVSNVELHGSVRELERPRIQQRSLGFLLRAASFLPTFPGVSKVGRSLDRLVEIHLSTENPPKPALWALFTL